MRGLRYSRRCWMGQAAVIVVTTTVTITLTLLSISSVQDDNPPQRPPPSPTVPPYHQPSDIVVTKHQQNYAPTFQQQLPQDTDITAGMELKYVPIERKVIVASYMRSGSSITGKILEQNQDTFYVFEPLLAIQILRKYYVPAMFMDGPIRFLRKDDDSMERTIESYLNCDLRNINLASLTQYHMDKSRTTEDFYSCSHTTTRRLWEKNCFLPFLNICLSKKNTLVKTIRMRVSLLEPLLEKYPELKIVHLIRDPRAIALSKSNLAPKRNGSDVISREIEKTSVLCKDMLKDLEASERLVQKYPEQVKILVYEVFASAPILTARNLFNYLEFSYTRQVEEFVYNSTSAGIEQNCQLCTSKANSLKTAMNWRKILSFEQVESFNKYCLPLFEKAGYTIFKDKNELLNFNIESWQYMNQPGYLV
ncbi:hypothetical protein SNE40_022450 [Patella caerulea]|uniref:Sulfotransferase domain-containing protein n=1 Tax=Patella caerulea TaxID=87958 RepID=A0AAN8GFZ3_PATCE